MLKLVVTDIERDRTETRFGGEDELLRWLHLRYPATRSVWRLTEAIMALDVSDLYRVKLEPYEPLPRKLPKDYETHSQRDMEDPWPRRG